MHSVLLYASETWAATQEDVSCLNCNVMMMMRWICSTNLTDKIPSDELRSGLGLCNIENKSSTYESRHMAKKDGKDSRNW